MNISDTGLSLIKSFEALRLTPYRDSNGYWTWAWGHKQGPHETIPASVTSDDAESILVTDVSFAVQDVNSLIVTDIEQTIFDALTSFLFNVGLTQLRAQPHRTMSAIQAHDWKATCTAMLRWDHDDRGNVVAGLYNRRVRETNLILKGVYA